MTSLILFGFIHYVINLKSHPSFFHYVLMLKRNSLAQFAIFSLTTPENSTIAHSDPSSPLVAFSFTFCVLICPNKMGRLSACCER